MPLDPRPLNERFDLGYARRRHWPHSWTRLLSIVLVLVVAGYLVSATYRRDRRIYSSGDLTSVHAMFGSDCAQCHLADADRPTYWLAVRDQACLKCHAATAHHPPDGAPAGEPDAIANMADRLGGRLMADQCSSCHHEHRGVEHDLTHLPDAKCTTCHAQLSRSAEPSPFDRITSFVGDHPPWRLFKGQPIDTTPLRMGHDIHMNPRTAQVQTQLRQWAKQILEAGGRNEDIPIAPLLDDEGFSVDAADGEPMLALTCTACHELDEAGRYILPIRFERHCEHCHGLSSVEAGGERFAIPHGSMIGGFIDRLAAIKATAPPKADAEKAPGRSGSKRGPRRGGKGKANEKPIEFKSNADLTNHITRLIDDQRGTLYRRIRPTCGKCHDPKAKLDHIDDPNIPNRWLPGSVFAHSAHRFLAYTQCHPAADGTANAAAANDDASPSELRWTKATKDVMMPDIASCRTCHAPVQMHGSTHESGGARFDCTMCHLYHDPPDHGHEGGAFVRDEIPRPLQIKDFLSIAE